jgi:hypothetical protein
MAIMVFATLMPTIGIADGAGTTDPPIQPPEPLEETTSDYSDLELLALSLYYYFI